MEIDPTFNIGNYYVTLTSYRNLTLQTKERIHPIMLGPVLIDQRKYRLPYFQLPAKMVKYNRSLEWILAFGNDGERTLT